MKAIQWKMLIRPWYKLTVPTQKSYTPSISQRLTDENTIDMCFFIHEIYSNGFVFKSSC